MQVDELYAGEVTKGYVVVVVVVVVVLHQL
jgi:hypothetical protein